MSTASMYLAFPCGRTRARELDVEGVTSPELASRQLTVNTCS